LNIDESHPQYLSLSRNQSDKSKNIGESLLITGHRQQDVAVAASGSPNFWSKRINFLL
jgi:hypothetical protein